MATAVPSPTFGATGFVAPAESAILTGVLADITSAFGGNVNQGLTTPQGQIASSEAAIIGDANDQFIFLSNQFDPAFASGRWQDGIGALYFLTRNPAVATVATCTCTGTVGVIIPTGALAIATDGNIYSCTAGAAIGGGGTISLPFACIVTGPIACPAGSLNQIYRSRPGWDSITNPADGVVGVAIETQQAFEARRQASVAGNAAGSIGAIIGAVAAVPGVVDFWGYANNTAGSVTVQGVTIAANAIYITVQGGTSAAVGAAILSRKSPGAPMGGNTTVTVTDPNPLYGAAPSYSITYEIPPALPLYVAVSIANSSAVPTNYLTLIQGVVQAAFLGTDGGPRARIGTTLYASRFYAGVASLGAWAQIVSIFVNSTASPTTPDVVINGNQFPTLSNANITVALV